MYADGSEVVHVVRTFVSEDPRLPVEKGAGTTFIAPDGTRRVVGKPIHLIGPDGGVRLLDAGWVEFDPDGNISDVRGPHSSLDVDLRDYYCPQLTEQGPRAGSGRSSSGRPEPGPGRRVRGREVDSWAGLCAQPGEKSGSENRGYRSLEARSLALLGRSLSTVDRQEAIGRLRHAADLFAACGSRWRRDQVLADLDNLGKPGRRAAGALRGPTALTDREREIAALAAQGLTAKAIGQQLHIGERTVETHVARVYAKFDVHTRRELVRALAASAVVTGSGGSEPSRTEVSDIEPSEAAARTGRASGARRTSPSAVGLAPKRGSAARSRACAAFGRP